MKLGGLLYGSVLLSWVWAAAILGGLTRGFFVFILSWATVYFIILVPAALLLVVQRIKGRGREYDDSQADNPYQGKFFKRLLGTRREYSRFLVDKYYGVLQEHPDEKKRLIRIATRAVSKNKKNPEARYIFGKSYLDLGEVAKAQKHGGEALRLEPNNEKYKALCAQIEKVL